MTIYPVLLFTGTIRPLPESGRPTGMYKSGVTVEVRFTTEGIVGDEQADRRVHGGPEKAVHLYPANHYRQLAQHFPEAADLLHPGTLGENISVDGLDESQVHIGDIWQLGSALLQLCQPRNPCWKIDERLGTEGVAEYIAKNHLTGWYWRVVQEGCASPGDLLTLITRPPESFSLLAAMSLWAEHRPDLHQLRQLTQAKGIAAHWQSKIQQRLDYLSR